MESSIMQTKPASQEVDRLDNDEEQQEANHIQQSEATEAQTNTKNNDGHSSGQQEQESPKLSQPFDSPLLPSLEEHGYASDDEDEEEDGANRLIREEDFQFCGIPYNLFVVFAALTAAVIAGTILAVIYYEPSKNDLIKDDLPPLPSNAPSTYGTVVASPSSTPSLRTAMTAYDDNPTMEEEPIVFPTFFPTTAGAEINGTDSTNPPDQDTPIPTSAPTPLG